MGSAVNAQSPIYQKGQLTIPHNAEGPRDANGKFLGISQEDNTLLYNTFWYWKDASKNHVFLVLQYNSGNGYQLKISDASAKSERFKSTKIEKSGFSNSIQVSLPEDGFSLTKFSNGVPEVTNEIRYIDKNLDIRGTSTPKIFYWCTEYKRGAESEWLQFVEKKVKEVFGLN